MKFYKNRFYKIFNRKHSGAVAFETVIVMPVVFTMFMMSIIFFFTMLSFISYNNVASTIAQHLDMRATGYTETLNTSLSSNVTGGMHYNVDGNNIVSGSSIRTYSYSGGSTEAGGQDSAMLGGLNAALNKIAGDEKGNQLNMPFTAIKSITAYNDKPINLTSSKKNAGNTIKVTIEYYPLSFMGSGDGVFGKIMMRAVGYATIS